MSVQPKGTPAPAQGLPDAAAGPDEDPQRGHGADRLARAGAARFFGKLLPVHAERLKGARRRPELARSLLARQLETAFQPLPLADSVRPGPLAHVPAGDVAMAPHFSAEEIETRRPRRRAGRRLGPSRSSRRSSKPSPRRPRTRDPPQALDIGSGHRPHRRRARAGARAAVDGPPAGRLRLPDAHQGPVAKVRLSYVSSGRSFFAFTHGRKHQETLSFTARAYARAAG